LSLSQVELGQGCELGTVVVLDMHEHAPKSQLHLLYVQNLLAVPQSSPLVQADGGHWPPSVTTTIEAWQDPFTQLLKEQVFSCPDCAVPLSHA
jgi:hypothetical protein